MGLLRVAARRDGFRRAGRAWSAAETVVDAADLKSEQVAALKADPMLIVTEDADSRGDLIRAAFADLDPENAEHFTRGGKPELAALRERTGLSDLTAAERDRRWAERGD